MTSATENSRLDQQANECPTCKQRRETYVVIGLTIFMVSLCSCGTLTFFAIPVGVLLQCFALRKCKACREKIKALNEST